MKKWLLLLLLALVMLGAVFAVKTKQAQNAAFVPAIIPPILVEAWHPHQTQVVLTQRVQVTIKAEVEQLLTARVTAQVTELSVREGDKVKAGALLAQLDDKSSRADISVAAAQLAQYRLEQASIQDQLDAAKLDLQAQKDTLARLKKLASIQAASADQLQQQQVRVAQAEQRLSSAKSQLKGYDELLNARSKQSDAAQGALGYVRLTALQDAVVAERLVQEGDIVSAGTPIMRLIGQDAHRRLLIALPADTPTPAGVIWRDQLQSLKAWPSANAQGLRVYEARLEDSNLIPNQQLSMSLATYYDQGIHLPSGCFIPHHSQQAQVVIHAQGKATSLVIDLVAQGREGIVTQDERLLGQELVCASSDVLLRLLAGRSFRIHAGVKTAKES